MKKTYIQPYSQQLTFSNSTELMLVKGSHTVESFKEAGTMNIGGDEGDVDGLQPATGSGARERLLWGEGKSSESLPSGSLW